MNRFGKFSRGLALLGIAGLLTACDGFKYPLMPSEDPKEVKNIPGNKPNPNWEVVVEPNTVNFVGYATKQVLPPGTKIRFQVIKTGNSIWLELFKWRNEMASTHQNWRLGDLTVDQILEVDLNEGCRYGFDVGDNIDKSDPQDISNETGTDGVPVDVLTFADGTSIRIKIQRPKL